MVTHKKGIPNSRRMPFLELNQQVIPSDYLL